ncbi:Protein hipA [Serinicoccus hydrothermalis]|uniref:Protein hipA n=1 Tax=Serinicoccus hydrothermalis TaxID=1758689 RepID=A0A1B1NC26_9MICO|nr:HipA domain-containing protein [Serinicoccus hydrothermalis]ANS78989.1 Protein hipA [Serinicoccus hydrothermalis]
MRQAIDPRDVRRAQVLKAGRPAATLERADGTVTFRYDQAYLEEGGPPVATTLPLTDEPVVRAGGAVPPFFANLLPEGRRLTALRRSVKTSADDDMSLLLAVGADPVGDVRVLPEGWAPDVGEPVVATTSSTASFAELDFSDLLEQAGVGDPSALAGVQDKVSGRMLSLPLVHDGRGYLLKFEVPEFPHVVANEAYFLGLARRLRHPVASARVVHDRHERPALLVERFDREVTPTGEMRRLAVEDGAQLLGLYPADKYATTSETLARGVAAVTAARPVALRAVFTQLAYAWATGNGDLHAKNLSVLQRSGEWRVSPMYDVPSTVPYGDPTAALPLAGRRENLTRKAFLEFAETVRLPERAATRSLDDVLLVTEQVVDEVEAGAIGLDPRRRGDLVRTLRRRRRDLGA